MVNKMLHIFAILLLTQSTDFTIVVNNNSHSKILISELNRDWKDTTVPFNTLSQDTKIRIAKYEEISKAIRQRLHIIDVSKPTVDNFQYSNFKDYPVLIYSYSSKPTIFDKRAFKYPGFALLYINSTILDIEYNEHEYLEIVQIARYQSHKNNLENVANWLKKNLPEEEFNFVHTDIYAIPIDIECQIYPSLDDYVNKFGHYDGFPELMPDIIPIRPICPIPWELRISSREFEFLPVIKN
jgi:hypothetical protein